MVGLTDIVMQAGSVIIALLSLSLCKICDGATVVVVVVVEWRDVCQFLVPNAYSTRSH
jgi:hypothetical protein